MVGGYDTPITKRNYKNGLPQQKSERWSKRQNNNSKKYVKSRNRARGGRTQRWGEERCGEARGGKKGEIKHASQTTHQHKFDDEKYTNESETIKESISTALERGIDEAKKSSVLLYVFSSNKFFVFCFCLCNVLMINQDLKEASTGRRTCHWAVQEASSLVCFFRCTSPLLSPPLFWAFINS
jgi:hypothetical protein